MSVVTVALVAVRLVKNPVTAVKRLEKKLVEVAKVVDALVAVRLVVVLFVKRASVAKRLDDEELVVDAFVTVRLVPVADEKVVDARSVCPLTVSAVDDAFPSTV